VERVVFFAELAEQININLRSKLRNKNSTCEAKSTCGASCEIKKLVEQNQLAKQVANKKNQLAEQVANKFFLKKL
jgi:hypothetical protein